MMKMMKSKVFLLIASMLCLVTALIWPAPTYGQTSAEAGMRAEIMRMFKACTDSGGKAAATYDVWLAQNGCICPGSTRGSGRVTCSSSSNSAATTGIAAANPSQTTGSLTGDVLNLGANLWIAQNVKNPYTAQFMQSFSQSFLTSFFASRAEAQRQQQLMNEALRKRQQEAAEQARIAEQARLNALFARLNSELKLSGSPTYLALKTSGGVGDLPLKLGVSDGGQGLKLLKLGNDNAQGAGINGLPGLYVGGPANGSDTNADTDGLKLKVGETSTAGTAPPPPPATANGMGIPGLPGIYLNDVPPEHATELANAATNLSGPERQVAQDAALAAAQKNPALTGPSDDRFVLDYQNEAKAYAQALQKQQEALQKATEAEGHAQASRAVVEYIGSQMDPAAQTEAQKQALQQLSLSAASDEAAAEEARRNFENTNVNLSMTRSKAAGALAALAPALSQSSGQAVVDLSGVRQPYVMRDPKTLDKADAPIPPAPTATSAASLPQPIPERHDVATGVNQVMTGPVTEKITRLPPGGVPIFDCAADKATLNRLLEGMPAQKARIDRTAAELDDARKDYDQTYADARWSALKGLTDATIGVVDRSRILLARAEMMKNIPGTTAQVAARWKLLQTAKTIADTGKELEDLAEVPEKVEKAYRAGEAYGNAVLVKKTAHDLSTHIDELNKLLEDSGLKEEAAKQFGETMATATWGPVGKAGFNLATDAIDLLADLYQGVHSAQEAASLRHALDVMRSQYFLIASKIYDLQNEMQNDCGEVRRDTRTADK